jgi:glutamate synthase (ferredoxin)
MRAREELMKVMFLAMTSKNVPIILEGKSDSAMDMVIELLLMTGRSLPEVMMMVPEAWEKHQTMSDDKKHFTNTMLVLWNLGMDLPLFRLLMEM